MAGNVQIVLNGAKDLNKAQRASLVKWIKHGLGDIASQAGKPLLVSIPMGKKPPAAASGTYHIEIFLEAEPPPKRRCGFVLGMCGSGWVSITNHKYLGICGTNSKTRNTRIITTDELLGHALANTVLHEVGHLVSFFDDNKISGNFMSTIGPPRATRTLKTQREFFAGTMSWSEDQKKSLVKNIKAGKKAFEDEFTVTPIQSVP
jgi:hypothetical protein